MGQATQEQPSRISTRHNVVITAVPWDSAVQRHLNPWVTQISVASLTVYLKNNTYAKHTEIRNLFLDIIAGEPVWLWY